MKLIESKAEVLEQKDGLEGIYQMIELAGRTCYKSENKMTYNSSVDFVNKMIISGHTAMLEHGTVYLYYKSIGMDTVPLFSGPYVRINSRLTEEQSANGSPVYEIFITTNYRYIVENHLDEHLQYLCDPMPEHERRISLKFTTDRGVSHELVRHRVFSFAQESTRYCDYTKDKFGNELTFIKPSWFNDDDENSQWPFLYVLDNAERMYRMLINPKGDYKWTPQQARQVLPNAIKTEIVMTGFVSDWKHFFDLRLFGTTGKPHPDMLLLAEKAKKALEEKDLWGLIYKLN